MSIAPKRGQRVSIDHPDWGSVARTAFAAFAVAVFSPRPSY